MGQYQRAGELADQAEQLAAENSSRHFDADVRVVRGTVYRLTGRADAAVSVCAEAVASAGQRTRGRLPDALIALARARYDGGELRQACADADRALQLARLSSLRVDEGRALNVLAAIHEGLGQHVQAGHYVREAVEIAVETGYVPPPHEQYSMTPEPELSAARGG